MKKFISITLFLLLALSVWADSPWKKSKGDVWKKPGVSVKLPDALPGILDNSGNLMAANLPQGVSVIFLPSKPGQSFKSFTKEITDRLKAKDPKIQWTNVEPFQVGQVAAQMITTTSVDNGIKIETALVMFEHREKKKRLTAMVTKAATTPTTAKDIVTAVAQGIEFK